jgi:hypothetical protein
VPAIQTIDSLDLAQNGPLLADFPLFNRARLSYQWGKHPFHAREARAMGDLEAAALRQRNARTAG